MSVATDLSAPSLAVRIRNFSRQPWAYKKQRLFERIWSKVPWFVLPIRLPFGFWWLGQYEYSTDLALTCGYELGESAFVEGLVRDGMTVIDVGANRGYYAMLTSRIVGEHGRVIAFEPSPRDLRFLRANLLLNGCRNVSIVPIALGKEIGEAKLFVPKGYSSGCNCLRSRAHEWPGYDVAVKLETLDRWIDSSRVGNVDFLKLDIEGGELDVLEGAPALLERRPRPVILCELMDDVSRLWGREAQETVKYLQDRDFEWFSLTAAGKLLPMAASKREFPFHCREESYRTNFVAIPRERLAGMPSGIWARYDGVTAA